MKQSTFVAALKFASHAMALKDIRYYLNGVLFEFRGSILTLVGTDGQRMAYVEVVNAPGKCVDSDIIVDTASVKLLLTAFKENSTAYITFEHGTDLLIVRGAGDMAIPCKPIEGKYPDWRRVCKSGAEPVPTKIIGFNADYMASASKACGAFSSSKDKGVRMTMFGPNVAVRVTPDTLADGITEACVVVMPMRL